MGVSSWINGQRDYSSSSAFSTLLRRSLIISSYGCLLWIFLPSNLSFVAWLTVSVVFLDEPVKLFPFLYGVYYIVVYGESGNVSFIIDLFIQCSAAG